DAAGHRRLHRQQPRFFDLIRRYPNRAQTRLCALELRLRLGIVTLRLLAVLNGGTAAFLQAGLAVEPFFGPGQRRSGLFVVGKSLREIAGVERQKFLPLHDPFAELPFEAYDTPGNRRQYLDGAAWIGLDDRWQDQIAPDVFEHDRRDGDRGAHRRSL